MSDAAEVMMAVFCIYEHLTRIPRREGTTAAEGHLWPSCLVQGMRMVSFIMSANVPDVSDRLNNEIGKVCNILCLAMSEIMHEGYSAPGGFCMLIFRACDCVRTWQCVYTVGQRCSCVN